jgi:site-specific DNA recombinase
MGFPPPGEPHLSGAPADPERQEGVPRRDQRRRLLLRPPVHQERPRQEAQAASEAVQLDIKIAEAEAVGEALTDRLGRGEITLAHYDLVIKPVDERIASLRAERAALPDPGPVPGTQQSLGTSRAQWRQRWDTADYKGKRDLLKMALRGKHLVIEPAQRGRGSADLDDVVGRVSVGQG